MSWFKRTVDRLTGAQERDPERKSSAEDRLGSASTAEAGTVPIANVAPRERVRITGQVDKVRVNDESPRFEALLHDRSGSLWLIFLGRRSVDGVVPGAHVIAEGRTCTVNDALGIFNPRYELLDRRK